MLSKEEISKIYIETMRQMDIDFNEDLELIKKIKSNSYSIDNIQEALNFERDSFFTKYSWTIIPSFFHIDTIRKDYLSKSTERCKIIWDEIYNS